jgi:hypothetical protein
LAAGFLRVFAMVTEVGPTFALVGDRSVALVDRVRRPVICLRINSIRWRYRGSTWPKYGAGVAGAGRLLEPAAGLLDSSTENSHRHLVSCAGLCPCPVPLGCARLVVPASGVLAAALPGSVRGGGRERQRTGAAVPSATAAARSANTPPDHAPTVPGTCRPMRP